MKRVLTASVLVIVVYLLLKQAPLPVFWGAVILLAGIGATELERIFAQMLSPPWRWLSLSGTVAVAATFIRPEPPLHPVLAATLVLLLVAMVASRETPAVAARRALTTLFTVFYLGLTFGHMGGLLALDANEARESGEDLLAFALFAVYFGDTFAYYGGRRFGRRKLAPEISPGKTVEGAICGLIGSMAGAMLGPLWFFQRLPIGHALLLGAVLGATGILGDLAESLLKRAGSVKDSGALLPGHGGILDRIDSLLLAAPVLYWYHRLVLTGL